MSRERYDRRRFLGAAVLAMAAAELAVVGRPHRGS